MSSPPCHQCIIRILAWRILAVICGKSGVFGAMTACDKLENAFWGANAWEVQVASMALNDPAEAKRFEEQSTNSQTPKDVFSLFLFQIFQCSIMFFFSLPILSYSLLFPECPKISKHLQELFFAFLRVPNSILPNFKTGIAWNCCPCSFHEIYCLFDFPPRFRACRMIPVK